MAEDQDDFTETPKQKFQRELREYEGKNIQEYSANLTAWFNTKLEKDKSIITISSAAIGLLVTILTTKGVQSFCQVAFYSLAFLCFLTAIILAINVLVHNAEHIEKVVTNQGNCTDALNKKDQIINISFYLGIIFTIFIGISYAASKFINEQGGKKMTEENERPSDVVIIIEGVGGSERLKPVLPQPPVQQDNSADKKDK